MSHLYITDNGSNLGVEGGRFIIRQKDELVRTIPKESVEAIFIFGNTSVSVPCMKELLYKRIPTCFFSSNGSYYGRLISTQGDNVPLMKKQFSLFEEEAFVMEMSKKISISKINNQYILLKRYLGMGREDHERDLHIMKGVQDKIQRSQSVAEIMGYEGMAARMYFNILGEIMRPEFAFKGRNRRPPKDPFNSLISLGYTLIMYEIMAKLEVTGLNPYCGILHSDRAGSPALASDMIEEWRAVLADSTALSLLQGGELKYDDFETDEDGKGVFLTKSGMRTFLNKFEKKLNTSMKYLDYDNKDYSFRQAISVQCKQMVECVKQRNAELYHPIRIR